jgi:hypothetical protein
VLRELRFSGARIADALGMSERTVRAVLARNGCPGCRARRPRARQPLRAPGPGELVHIDVKKLGKIGRPPRPSA